MLLINIIHFGVIQVFVLLKSMKNLNFSSNKRYTCITNFPLNDPKRPVTSLTPNDSDSNVYKLVY